MSLAESLILQIRNTSRMSQENIQAFNKWVGKLKLQFELASP